MMEPRRWIIHFYGTKSGFIDHLNLSLAELLDDSLHGTSTPTSSPLTPASTRSSPIEEWPNTRNAISPDSGSGLFVSLRGTYNKLPDQSSRGCTNYDLSRGFEDDDSDVISGVPSDEDQGSRSEEIFTAGGEGTVDAGGNNQILGNDEVMDDIEDQIEDPEQPIDVHGDETMKDLEDDKSVEEFGGTDNPERPQGSNGVGGDEDAGHSEADDSIRENPDAPEDVDEEIDVEDTGADGLIEEDQEASEGGVEDTGIDGSIEEDQEASEGGVEDTGIDGSIGEDQDVPERGAEDTGIDGSTREDAEASKGGPEDTGIDGSIGEDQDVPERGAEDTGIDGSTREDKEASEGGAEDTGIDGFIGEDEDVPERGAENIEIDRFTREDTEGSGEVNEDENTGNAGDQDGIGGKGREDEELVKAQTKTRKRWVEAADRIIQGGLSIAKSRELLSVAYNHEALRALLSLEVQGPKSYPLGSLTGGDPLRVAARYLEYSTRLEERLTWYKRVGHFTQVVAVSWCEILRHSGCTNEEVDAMIQKAMGKSFTPRWLKDARRGVKFVHRLIRALREDGWGDTAFEIFFLCGHSLSGYSKLAETPDRSFEILREGLTLNPPSKPDGWIPYSIPCIINAMTDQSLSLQSICTALGYDYNSSYEGVARKIEKYCEERPAMDPDRDNASSLHNEARQASRRTIDEAAATFNNSEASFDNLPSSALNRDRALTDFQQSDFTPFFDEQIPPSFHDDDLFFSTS